MTAQQPDDTSGTGVPRKTDEVDAGEDRLEQLGLTALAFVPFRIYLSANLVSNASWFIFSAGLGWYVLDRTGSAAAVGFAAFVQGLPFALFMLHAGILTDRFGPKRLVALALGAGGATMVGIGVLALGGSPLPIILVVAFLMGTFQTLGAPGFIAIVHDLVPPRAVSSGVVLTFFGLNVGRVTGGLLAGVLLSLHPEAAVAGAVTIIVAGILQGTPAIAIWRIRVARTISPSTGMGMIRPLVEAASHALAHPTLGVILVLAMAPGALGLSYMFILPVAVVELGAGPEGLGLLFAGGGVGGLLAGLITEPIMRRSGHGRSIFLGIAAAGAGLVVVGVVGLMPVAVVAVGVAQAGFVVYSSASLALVQTISPPRLRGRLTALYSLLYWGLLPIGGLLGGLVAEVASARFALAAAGFVIVTCGIAAAIGRRQLLSLRIARDGRTVSGEVDGTGYSVPKGPAA